MLLVWLFAFSLLLSLSLAQNPPFLAVSPSTLTRGRTYDIPISLFDQQGASSASLSLIDSSNVIRVSSQENFNGLFGTFSLTIPSDVPEGSYILKITCGEADSNATVSIYGEDLTVLLETDKPLYQPGQDVAILLLAINYQFKPRQIGMTVEISDPAQNKIARFSNVTTDSFGMAALNFQLAAQTTHGNWTITVYSSASNSNGYPSVLTTGWFNVSEYTLPLFDVTIKSTNSKVVPTDKSLKGSVTAKYTYGKGVNGLVHLRLSRQNNVIWYFGRPGGDVMEGDQGFAPPQDPGLPQPVELSKATVTLKNGLASFDLPLGNLENSYGTEFLIEATVQEEATGYKQTSQASIPYAWSAVDFQILGENSAVRPGLPYTIILSCLVSTEAGLKPCVDQIYQVYTYQSQSLPFYNTTTDLQSIKTSGGTALMTVNIRSNTDGISFSATSADGLASAYLQPSIMNSPSGSFISISQDHGPEVRVGDVVNIRYQLALNSTIAPQPLVLVYQAVARGAILETSSGHLEASGTSGTFALSISQDMMPQATVVCYAALTNGEIIADHLPILVEASLPLFVDTQLKPSGVTSGDEIPSALPGQDIQVVVQAPEQARVSLSAVDTSIFLLAESSRLNPPQIVQAITSGTLPSMIADLQWRQQYYAMDSFHIGGLVVLSDNVDVPAYTYPTWDVGINEADGGFAGGAGGGQMVDKNFEGAPAPTASAPAPSGAAKTKVRDYFPERWMFAQYTTDSTGRLELNWTAPDSITTWSVHTVAISQNGIGIAEAELKVAKPFFINVDLPISVTRGETFELTVACYNYMTQRLTVTVQVDNSENYKLDRTYENGNYATQQVAVQTDSVGAGTFALTPSVLGFIPIKVWGCYDDANCDVITKVLQVLPEGIPRSYVVNNLLDVNETSTVTKEFDLVIPSNVVPNSAKVFFSVTGDLMGQAMSNLENLIQMPSGCGEQTMITMAPCTFVADYFVSTGQSQTALIQKATNNMKIGYQRELTYRHADGSFSAFGERDGQGSMWLTAFVVKTFAQASEFIFIDPTVMSISGSFIAQYQNTDGSFQQTGQVIHTDLYGGLSGPVAHTAYVLIALLEAEIEANSAAMAVQYLSNQVDTWVTSNPSVYSVALVTYALAKASAVSSSASTAAAKAFNELKTRAISDAKGMHWTDSDGQSSSRGDVCALCLYCCPTSSSAEVEITAYGLLAFLENNDMGGAVSIARWLSDQRNSLGGYRSTQDTVMALQALASYATRTRSTDTNLNIALTSNDTTAASVAVNANNLDLLQTIEISQLAGQSVVLSATGHGKVATQVAISYNTPEADFVPAFEFTVEYLKSKSKVAGRVLVQACISYIPPKDSTETLVSFAVAEIGLPTGWYSDSSTLQALLETKGSMIKKYEQGDRNVILYIDEISTDQRCWNFDAIQKHRVLTPQPTVSKVYSYYNPDESAYASTLFLNPTAATKTNSQALAIGLGVGLGAGVILVAIGVFLYYRKYALTRHVKIPDDQTPMPTDETTPTQRTTMES